MSRPAKPTGTNSLSDASRTPGPLGVRDSASPDRPAWLRGDTPGPLGYNDLAAAIAGRWPEDRQQELAELALEIEAELAGAEYKATPDELAAIDEGLAGEAASDEEVKAAFALFGKV